MAAPERDEVTGTETTKHEWDGITELDTPLPRWWLWTFYITIVWGVAYTIAYPAWPLIDEATKGVLGYSSRAEVAEAIAEHAESNRDLDMRIASADWEEISSDANLDQYAQAGGAAVFRAHCSQCHGAGGAGAEGYPNLIDNAWLWGGDRDAIATTVRHGIRWEADDETRFGAAMPAFGRGELLEPDQIQVLADYVLSYSGRAETTEEGEQLFIDNCASCHGEDGNGMEALGAPNLTDAIWLYGGDREDIVYGLINGRAGVMPAWNTRLSEAQIKQVAHYVYTLGGQGQ